MKTLAIISHTEHYVNSENEIVGLGSTITEINHLTQVFDSIYHIAMLYEGEAPKNMMPYASDKITFVPIPPVGGKSWYHKIAILWYLPKTIRIVNRTLKKVDYFQFRAPTGIGVYLVPFLIYFKKTKGWFKYAGNWEQANIPLAFKFQRKLLRNQKRKVTINGKWSNQPAHCLTFENPCLTNQELENGRDAVKNKWEDDLTQLTFCFIGRVEKDKGIDKLLEAITSLPDNYRERIAQIHIVGDGAQMTFYKNSMSKSEVDIVFHGWSTREKVHDILCQSHVMLLPSLSEGFPKVAAEALNYGCLPIITKMDALLPYFGDDLQSFFLTQGNVEEIRNKMILFMNLSQADYQNLVAQSNQKSDLFSYVHYNERIKKSILNDENDGIDIK